MGILAILKPGRVNCRQSSFTRLSLRALHERLQIAEGNDNIVPPFRKHIGANVTEIARKASTEGGVSFGILVPAILTLNQQGKKKPRKEYAKFVDADGSPGMLSSTRLACGAADTMNLELKIPRSPLFFLLTSRYKT